MSISETPTNEVLIIFVPSAPLVCLDATRPVPLVHGV